MTPWPTPKSDRLRGLIASGSTYDQAAVTLGVSRYAIKSQMRHLKCLGPVNMGGPWDAAKVNRIVRSIEQGKSYRDIAADLGMSRRTVEAKIQRLRDEGTLLLTDIHAPKSHRALRKCLGPGCGRMFDSHGVGNRICKKCRGQRVYQSGAF
jgi:biotin operon repressor